MKRIVYPGTFDPIHNGHLDIARKAAELFDELILVVAVNQEKSPLFNDKERVELIKDSLHDVKNVKVDTFNGLVVDFVRLSESVAIIRGLRHVSDFEFEFQLAGMNKKLNSKIETMFLMSDVENQIISSKFVKEIAYLGGDINRFVTKYAVNKLKNKYQ